MRRITLIVYYLLTLAAAVFRLSREPSVYNALLAAAALALPAVPFLLYRLLRLRPVALFELVFDLFVFAAVPFASLFGGYALVPYWDKLLHFVSGFLFAALGMTLYCCLKPSRALAPADAPCAALFAWMTAMSSAVLWEIWEYLVSFSGADPQQVAATGVGDTMQDIIVCTLGGLLTARACLRYLKSGGKARKGVMMTLFERFYQANLDPKRHDIP